MESIEVAMEAVREYHECEYVNEFSEREEGHGLI